MSVFSVKPKEGSDVTTETLDQVCQKLGVRIKDEEKEAYTNLLAVFDESCKALLEFPDYKAQVDLDRFPRKDIRQVAKDENTHGAWAWRCSIQDSQPNDGILKGKRVVFKDMISVKDVPMLMGR